MTITTKLIKSVQQGTHKNEDDTVLLTCTVANMGSLKKIGPPYLSWLNTVLKEHSQFNTVLGKQTRIALSVTGEMILT